MSAIEKEIKIEEALISKIEVDRANQLFYHLDDDFLEIVPKQTFRSDASNMKEYLMVGNPATENIYLNANHDSFRNLSENDFTTANQLQEILRNDFEADPSCARLKLVSQIKASKKLNELGSFVSDVNEDAFTYNQSELREYMAHVISIDGIINRRAAQSISQKADYLNGLLAQLEDLKTWIIVNVHKDNKAPRHIAARLVEFRVHNSISATPTLEPIVLTKDNQRGLLPIYYSIDPNQALVFDDIRRNEF